MTAKLQAACPYTPEAYVSLL